MFHSYFDITRGYNCLTSIFPCCSLWFSHIFPCSMGHFPIIFPTIFLCQWVDKKGKIDSPETRFSKDHGIFHFYFSQKNQSIDYELWFSYRFPMVFPRFSRCDPTLRRRCRAWPSRRRCRHRRPWPPGPWWRCGAQTWDPGDAGGESVGNP